MIHNRFSLLQFIAIPIGFLTTSIYCYLATSTTVLKGSGFDVLFISSGIILAPIGAGLVWLAEYFGFIADSGMAGGFVMFAFGGFVLWFILFTLLSSLLIKFYVTCRRKNGS